MRLTPINRMALGALFLLAAALLPGGSGCGPARPKVLLESPAEYPDNWADRQLYHTPQGYIYARSETAAGEADEWLKEVKGYIKRKYKSELGKGVVVVMEPADEPVARTLEDELALERDPALMPTKPRKPKTVEEFRRKMADEGIPEGAMVRGATIPLPAGRLRQMGLNAAAADWAVAAPSHALAVDCGIEVGASALRKKKPDLTPEQARKGASMFGSSFAKGFEITRGDPVFVLWAQRQKDWSDDQRREAIKERMRHTCRSHWLPAPKNEDLEW
jgi:hypothetical protein